MIRVGLGEDCHRLVAGRPLILGGVQVEHDRGLDAHSDGDVLLHAVIDALLGAAGLGDIGEQFPNTSEEYKDADSTLLLAAVLKLLQDHDWAVINLDCTITAERPKLKEYKPLIRARIADLLQVSVECVNVKAKTGEGVGPVGREEAIMTSAAVLIEKTEAAPSP
ncbi:2-C-methyl-D-erythritol 2,4-cyclodiphosphate synthase [Calycomorphotria hydatis]|uniref:2-C-methyl-D-erythritol 2,4-cyclodiphosphate synthase n=1 Tax=Calycomorphotria hydatis TaxID=2528027 RepID=A0A517T4R6_9PLAN|nr:2-C-methyl-D-erythritol 2,4-cyclodiphosphate synthase [Calycomorphotria hydatis]QDT63376.1 2-C-methyl-D-erythritol 2,4-cyclodiphosphate synthase [Calycomorphotria hydatis]